MNCTNCNNKVNHHFCPNCGHASKPKRIDGHYIIHEIQHVLHFERGILFTVKGLLINPGQNIRNYISGNRSRLVKPVIFIIITSLIYTLISHFFHIEEEYIKYEGSEKSSVFKIVRWLQANYGYMNILTGIFIAVWLKLVFKKYKYNFFELLVMLCFVLGIPMLIYAFFAFIEGITDIRLLNIAGIIGVIYVIWAMAHFFEKMKTVNYFKALVCYVLGLITFFIFIFAIGITTDVLTKH